MFTVVQNCEKGAGAEKSTKRVPDIIWFTPMPRPDLTGLDSRTTLTPRSLSLSLVLTLSTVFLNSKFSRSGQFSHRAASERC